MSQPMLFFLILMLLALAATAVYLTKTYRPAQPHNPGLRLCHLVGSRIPTTSL